MSKHKVGDLFFSKSSDCIAIILNTNHKFEEIIEDSINNFRFAVKHLNDERTWFYTEDMIDEGKQILNERTQGR